MALTHYLKAFDRPSEIAGTHIAACGQHCGPWAHSTEPTCSGCAQWIADLGQSLPPGDEIRELTHAIGAGPWTLTTYAPYFRVRTVHHFLTEAGRDGFVDVARTNGLVIEARGFESAAERKAS